jgi:hypothetical protein
MAIERAGLLRSLEPFFISISGCLFQCSRERESELAETRCGTIEVRIAVSVRPVERFCECDHRRWSCTTTKNAYGVVVSMRRRCQQTFRSIRRSEPHSINAIAHTTGINQHKAREAHIGLTLSTNSFFLCSCDPCRRSGAIWWL